MITNGQGKEVYKGVDQSETHFGLDHQLTNHSTIIHLHLNCSYLFITTNFCGLDFCDTAAAFIVISDLMNLKNLSRIRSFIFTNNIIASITAPALHYIADNGIWINHNMTRTIFQILLWSTHTAYFYVVCFWIICHPQICDMMYSCYLFSMISLLVLLRL